VLLLIKMILGRLAHSTEVLKDVNLKEFTENRNYMQWRARYVDCNRTYDLIIVENRNNFPS
jgi:hypothetical protein